MTKEELLKNLVDEKYYRRVSNIIQCDDDMYNFLSMFYDPSMAPIFENSTNKELTPFSSICTLIKSNSLEYHIDYDILAYYIPNDVDTIMVVDDPMTPYDVPYYTTLNIETSLETVLEESRKLPNVDNVIYNYHKFGSKSIFINNIWHKRINIDLLGFYIIDDNDPNINNIYEEHLSYLFIDHNKYYND